jgi:hypothetical protein
MSRRSCVDRQPKERAMPLSEEEQKILREIEAQLNATDPELVDQVTHTTVYRHAGRNIRIAVLALVAGLAVVVTQFTNSTAFAALGFLLMLGALIVVADNLKKMGKASINDLLGIRGGMARPSFLDALRDRMRRDENDPV